MRRIYGLVGRNGSGKSTLLRKIEERQGVFYSGVPSHFNILRVHQEAEASDEKILDYVIKSDRLLNKLLQKMEEDEGDANHEIIENRLKSIDGYTAVERATKILLGLQFSAEDLTTRSVNEFSGGWRMRISSATALFCNPSLLLLDEPTNHLDQHSVEWLCEHLKSQKSGIIV